MEEQKISQDDSMVMDMKAEKDSSSNKRNIHSIVLELNEPSKKHKVDDSGVVEACAMKEPSSASKEPTSSSAITALSEEIQQLSEDISYYYELLAKLDHNGTQAGYAESEIQKLIEDTKEERMRKQMEYDTLLVEAFDKLMIHR